MGKPAVIKKCLRCNKDFWDKLKKNKVTKQYEEKEYCQKCRHLREVYKQKIIKERTSVRVIADKIDLRREVETLRRLENYNPRLLDKLRSSKND